MAMMPCTLIGKLLAKMGPLAQKLNRILFSDTLSYHHLHEISPTYRASHKHICRI
jgi:hypothetical protein